MTVTYTAEVSTCKRFGSFITLLLRWRGSIYKIIWRDLFLFLVLYYLIHLIYCYLISANGHKNTFENIVDYCSSYLSLIPLSFVLGFYVNLVMYRWWEQYIAIPWPDSVAVFVSTCVHGQDEGGRLMRRTIMRYVCLCLTIVFTMISPGVKKRFPNFKYLVDAGLLLENERQIFEKLDAAFPNYPKHWMPIIWAASIITRARREGRIRDDFAVKTIIDELNDFRGRCGTLSYYDFISVPLVYTQVVTIAVYSFFVCSLLAHQWTEKKKNTYEEMDFYYPIFITLEFFFYMGWLKVAEALMNPFGEDDDDFEVNWMIDRNLQVSYLIVDEMHHEHPELVKDQYWDEIYPSELPYISEANREYPPQPSTAKYDLLEQPRNVDTRLPSTTNSNIINGKPSPVISSSRSQRFTEAFQRFFNYNQDDSPGSFSDVENNLPNNVSDIESLEHITSYDQARFGSQKYNELVGEASMLEPITEEFEENFALLEEERTFNGNEEDYGIETQSSHESDTDSDPFERLRIERQKQRVQRMNDYLERHFGPNFRIVTQFSDTTEAINKTKGQKSSTNIPLAQKTSNSNELVSNILIQFQSESDQSQTELENVESVLAPKVSNEILIPKASLSASAIDKSNKQEFVSEMTDRNSKEVKSFTHFQGDKIENLSFETLRKSLSDQVSVSAEQLGPILQESQVSFEREINNENLLEQETQLTLLKELSSTGVTSRQHSSTQIDIFKPEAEVAKSQKNVLGNDSLLTLAQVPSEQNSSSSIEPEQQPDTLKIILSESIPQKTLSKEDSSISTSTKQSSSSPQNESNKRNLLEGSCYSKEILLKSTEIQPTTSSNIVESSGELRRLLESKATSPFASPSISTQSSYEDWETQNFNKIQTAKENRADTEDSSSTE